MKVLEIIFLAIGIFFTLVNVAKIIKCNSIPAANFIYWTIGIVGFIICKFYL